MGPGGSGKTVASAYKGPWLASSWFPVCRDGVIRVKMTVLRDTYRDLSRTALDSWHHEKMFPVKHPFTTEYTGGIDRPVKHVLKWQTMRGGSMVPVEFTALFAAIGDANPEQFAKGFETSFVWLNECDMLGDRIAGLMYSRTGRYPSVDQISPSELERVTKPFRQIMRNTGMRVDEDEVLLPRVLWGDCNPPDFDNWVPKRMIDEPEKWPLYKMFRQPSGLSPQAENRIGKPRSSYEQDLQTMTANDARRFVHGELGYALDGKPVYGDEFSTIVHRADQTIAPAMGLPLALGVDAGGSPAAAICQFMPNGQLRVLAEVCAEPGTGPGRFSEMLFTTLMARFPNFAIREAFGDPSAWYGADKVKGELSWMETVNKALSLTILPTETNEISQRQEAVRWYLKMIDVNTPRMLIDPSCKKLIGGFAAHYKLTKLATAGKTDTIEVNKNEYSHIHDALQYLCLGHQGRASVIKGAAQMGRAANVVPLRGNTVSKKSFDVFA